MLYVKPKPVASIDNLRARVCRLFDEPARVSVSADQLSLDLSPMLRREAAADSPSQSLASFMGLISDAMLHGDVYVFGGVLRDLALLGRRGFHSDIDLVVEGDWSHVVSYLQTLKAKKNKFGGYRVLVGGWPIDIWNAKETWAIRQGYVLYKGIASLTDTTVLNWDAILMSWRTKSFIYRKNYFEEISERILDVVLEDNPNPLGMAVRVFRHLCLKDARKITIKAVAYLAHCTETFSFEEIKSAELRSYSKPVIDLRWYRLFECINGVDSPDIRERFLVASGAMQQELELRDQQAAK